MRRSLRTLPGIKDRSEVRPIPSWRPIPFLLEHLQAREGMTWQREDTQLILERAEEIDAVVENLMRAAGLKSKTEQ
jgi:hypothetical protein